MKLTEAIAILKQHLFKANSPFEAKPFMSPNAVYVAYRQLGHIQRVVILNTVFEPLIFEVPNNRVSVAETVFNSVDMESTSWGTSTLNLNLLPEDSVVMQLYNEGMLYKQPEAAT